MRHLAVLLLPLALLLPGGAHAQGSGSVTLDNARARGALRCGTSGTNPGFAFPDSRGEMRGSEADFCRAVAAATLGDATRVQWVTVTSTTRFTALQSGEVDLLVRTATWTLGREASLGLLFAGITFFDGSTLVPRAIRVFRDRHPDIAISLQITTSAQVRELIVSGQFGIGLAADEVDLSGVDHRVFSSARALCAVPPGHALACQKVIHAADLDGEPFLALAPEDQARARLRAVFDAAGVRPRIVVETSFSNTVCALALEGAGIGLVNPGASEGFAARGLVLLPFEPAVHFRTFLLFRPDAQKAVLVKHFVAALLNARLAPPRPAPAAPGSPGRAR